MVVSVVTADRLGESGGPLGNLVFPVLSTVTKPPEHLTPVQAGEPHGLMLPVAFHEARAAGLPISARTWEWWVRVGYEHVWRRRGGAWMPMSVQTRFWMGGYAWGVNMHES